MALRVKPKNHHGYTKSVRQLFKSTCLERGENKLTAEHNTKEDIQELCFFR